MDDAFRNILYHYTDFQAVDGILRCAQLRVNDVLRMNDSAEMRHFIKRLCAAISTRLERDGYPDQAARLRAIFAEEVQKEYSAFAACFSFHRDDASQWERYGNAGRGVCIGFRREHLQRLAKGGLSLQAVFYQDDVTNHPMVERFYNLAATDAPVSADDPKIKEALHDAWACSASYKHPSFFSEYEMRLIVSPFETAAFPIRPCYHVSNERIKKYYPLDLKAMCEEAGIPLECLIAEIIIGPDSTQSEAVFKDYLRDSGLPELVDRVSMSDCPLRTMLR